MDENEYLSLSKVAEPSNSVRVDLKIDYLDDDIIMIDNVKMLTEPSSTRLQMNAMAVCFKGKSQLELNGVPKKFCANQALICPPGTVFSNVMISPDFDFKIIFLSDRILHSFLREKMNIWTRVLYISRMHIFPIDEVQMEGLMLFYRMLDMNISSTQNHPYKTDMLQSLLRVAVLGICGAFEVMLKNGETPFQNSASELLFDNVATNQAISMEHNSSQILFQRFINLLNNSTRRHRSVQSFADELCITPKYLSVICKKNSGKTANAWITEHLLEDIRYYLRQTDYSIKEICNMLGFPNTSFFGKYVKEHFGMTPTQLRKQ